MAEEIDKILSNLIGTMGQAFSTLNYEQKIRLIMWLTEMSFRYKISPKKIINKMKEVEKVLKTEKRRVENERGKKICV